jgi:hypothetical protein
VIDTNPGGGQPEEENRAESQARSANAAAAEETERI